MYVKPTAEMIAEYQKNKEIVEAHGGTMKLREHELAGESPRFTKKDVASAVAHVLEDNPDLEFHEHWNGEGCISLSVGCRDKKEKS